MVTVLGSSRLSHVIVQSEVETLALDGEGAVRWRVAHSDVIAGAELVAGTLTLLSYGGDVVAFDPGTGRVSTGVTAVDERWIARCVPTPHTPSVPLTDDHRHAYRRPRPEGALEPTNGQDDITAHVAWKVPSGRCMPITGHASADSEGHA